MSERQQVVSDSFIQTCINVMTSVWQPGSCVVDPMCGVGTILIEAAQDHEVRPERWRESSSKSIVSCCCKKSFMVNSLSLIGSSGGLFPGRGH